MQFIDTFLDRITMYRLVLYYLIALLGVGCVLGAVGLVPYSPLFIVFSTFFIIVISWAANKVFAWAFHAPTNVESVYISALIIALIVSPAKSYADVPLLFWVSVLTMASKFILAYRKKHIFNPVAIAVVLTSLGFNGSASWWVGSTAFLPVALLGLLIVRKIRRWDLVFYFFVATALTIFTFSIINGTNVLTTLRQAVIASPLFFFATVMLTEPLTTPPTKKQQTIYGIIAGILFTPQFHLGPFYASPETALVIANIYAYIVSPKIKILGTVLQKLQLTPDTIDFLLPKPQGFNFTPGQYMEWTLPHTKSDSRGNRRYFTIASSPTESDVRLGIKFYPNGSSYKKALASIDTKTPVVGAGLSGDFVLPKDQTKKLVFIAGGIGITPFRSMLKYLIDTNEKRSIIMMYANKHADEIVYVDVLNQAREKLAIPTVYTLTDQTTVPANWQGCVGRIDSAMLTRFVPDFTERSFYLSGPHTMVKAYETTLLQMGVKKSNIKIDFFPGFV